MKVFTIKNGIVETGANVEEIKIESRSMDSQSVHQSGLLSQKFSFFAISVGEKGRGRRLATLPIDIRCINQDSVVLNADIGNTKSGKPKLFPETNSDNTRCIVVFRTQIGYRGGNSHTGDRKNTEGDELQFEEFPGEILCQGTIAQGDAGRMGSGSQLIAVMPKGIVFRTGYSGRLYGDPKAHYYMFDGEDIIAVTWEQREDSDIF